MVKTIEIEGKSITFKASAFSPIQYNAIFPGHDFMKDMSVLETAAESMEKDENGDAVISVSTLPMEVYEYFVKIAYLFAYQGLAPTPRPTQEQIEFREKYPDPWEWIDTFDTFSIYQILPEIMELWNINEKQAAKAKKINPIPPGK